MQAPGPVEGQGVPAERRRLGLDVLVGPVGGMRITPDRGVLRRQAEGVPPDRVQNVVAALEVVARYGVSDRVRLGVPHVQVARRVREHVEHVGTWPGIGRVVAGHEQAQLFPPGQPLVLDRPWVPPVQGLAGCRCLLLACGCHVSVIDGCHCVLAIAPYGLHPALDLFKQKAPRSRGAAAPTDQMVGAAN